MKPNSTFVADMDELLWDYDDLSCRTGINERTIRRWYAANDAPEDIATWLHTLAEFHRANPAPVRENV